jgi:hypothetical protein
MQLNQVTVGNDRYRTVNGIKNKSCDSGCNKELIDPSYSQLIHNFAGLLTYLFVPFFMILIGFGLKKSRDNNTFSLQSIAFGAIGILFVYILVSNSKSEYIGLYQRMIELVLVTWIIFCAIAIKNIKPAGNNVTQLREFRLRPNPLGIAKVSAYPKNSNLKPVTDG